MADVTNYYKLGGYKFLYYEQTQTTQIISLTVLVVRHLRPVLLAKG